MVSTKSLVSTLLLAITGTFAPSQGAQAAVYSNGMNPGMALRLEENTILSWKKAMVEFLPRYINHDLEMPTDYHYTFGLLFDWLTWQVDWTNITYEYGEFDIRDCQFGFSNRFNTPMLQVAFPALKEWKMHAMQKTNSWFLPEESKVELEFKKFKFDISCQLKVTDEGYLKPITYSADIKFGESYLYHDNQFVAVIMHQIVQFGLVIVENSVYFVGEYIFTNMAGPVLTTFLNDYKFPLLNLPSPFHGQNTVASFNLDYRQTIDPYLGEGWMDTYFLGELTYGGQECTLDADYFDFMDDQEFSQLVISESAATCGLNNIARSPIGKLDLNEDRLNQFFGVTNLKFDTTNFAKHIPIFKEKIGPNKPLRVKITYKDVNALFGQFDTDIILDYTMCLSFSLDTMGAKELLYDEVKMITSMNMQAKDDILFIQLLNHKLNVNNKHGQKTVPMRNGMNLTANEYREFLSTFGFTNNYMKKWMNDVVFRNGVKFPYNMKEIYTTVKFQEKSAHIFLEVEENMDKLLEHDLWKN